MPARNREVIPGSDLTKVDDVNPLAEVHDIKGVRIYDVGQGDGIAILGDDDRPVMQIDYGGRQGNPFQNLRPQQVDGRLPVDKSQLVMITHWDEDHWCSAQKAQVVRSAKWLVPRQVTSPRAVRFSTTLQHISCIPESRVGEAFCFRATNGDEVWWEKIGKSEADATRSEDCNMTGVAFSIVKRTGNSKNQVILVPGDAPFDRVRHYRRHMADKLTLRGLIAFHHGAKTHWTRATRQLLHGWSRSSRYVHVIFSYAEGNTFDHPFEKNYEDELGRKIMISKTPDCRANLGRQFIDLLF